MMDCKQKEMKILPHQGLKDALTFFTFIVLMNCIIVHIETDHEILTLKNWKVNPYA